MKIKQIYHLTPNGWVKGFYKNEAGDFIENPDIPVDRVSTVRFVQNSTTPMGGIGTEETYTTPDIDLLNKLSEQYPMDMLPFPEDE